MSRRLLYLEPVGGIAGDMFLAAALDLGVPLEKLREALSSLPLSGYRLTASRTVRHGIAGTHLEVEMEPRPGEERSLAEIRSLIEASGMPARAKERALAVFQRIGEAEAKVHEVPLERIHFHEVGAVDSVVDICGAAVALELLGDPEVYAAPPPLGSGLAKTEHGFIPVPGPATLELLRGLPVRFEGTGELTTPTGAALLATLARIELPPQMAVERVGYGVGTQDFPDRPNLLRASLGQRVALPAQATWVLEANLDDCTPQLLGALLERLLQQGALDAYVLPATMKKSRPGHLLGVLAPADKKEALVQAILAESTTLGVRSHPVERVVLERSFQEVETPFGRVRVKLGRLGERVLNAQPELEDCRALAEQAGVPLKRVLAEALAAYWRPGKGA